MKTFISQAVAGNRPMPEINTLPSETVPDQSLSVREIMVRFANGTLNEVMHEPFYSEDLPDMRNLDIIQMYEMRDAGRKDLQVMEESVKKAKEKKQTKPPAEEAEIVE